MILEAHYLTDEQIVRASRLCVQAGAAFVKTGTGWAPTGATLHNVALIKQAVGDTRPSRPPGASAIWRPLWPCCGWVCSGLGSGWVWCVKILEECAALPGGAVDV